MNEKNLEGGARRVDPKGEPELAGKVRRLMDDEYSWSDGTIVELTPGAEEPLEVP